jgi:outer membrane protein OmpA-like peptidoglycan-associated protein
MRYILFTILGLCLSLVPMAQIAVEIEQGDKAYNEQNFEEALYFYESANDLSPNSPIVTRKIGQTYRRMGQMNISAEWFRKTIELGSTDPLDMLYYAEALKSLAQYDEAIVWYEKYLEKNPTDSRALSHTRDKEYYLDLFADTLRYQMKRMLINSDDPIMGITNFKDDEYLVSAIDLTKQKSNSQKDYLNYLDIYSVTMNSDNELVKPSALEKTVNSKLHDGPAAYCSKDQTLYITRNNESKKKGIVNKNLKIYASQWNGSSWSSAKELEFNDDEFSNGHPSLTTDGAFLYFVSDRPGGMGGTDIYVSQRLGDTWSEPINLGKGVNTEGNEMFPFIAANGALFYSSDGHAGLGGLDIFVSLSQNGIWQKPENLGSPVNSTGDDFGLLYEKAKDHGFFVSNRSGRGNDDIYFYNHVQIEKTLLAGYLKTDIPKLSLAGEKIKITTVNTGMVSEQRLDENEGFKITAEPGDSIAVFMMNAEYFDTTKAVFGKRIENPILDPYISLGTTQVEFIKIPSFTGRLSEYSTASLVQAKSRLNNTKEATTSTLTASSEKVSTVTNPDASTMEDAKIKAREDQLRQGQVLETNYQNAMNMGASLLELKKFDEAIEKFEEAKTIKPKDDAATAKLEEARRRKADLAAGKVSFNDATSIIDLNELQIDNIQFDYNKAYIRQVDYEKLEQVVALMRSNKNTKLLIKAYCDSRGSMTYNQSLSMNRAMAVQGYLIQKGIPRERLQAEWYGEQRPLNECEDNVPCTEEQYEVNRRAEFKIIAQAK